MANPTLTPFPTPPLPEQDEVTFNRNAANSLLAQANFVTEGNIVITWMGQQIDAAAASKKAAADSATAAGQAVTDAQSQVKLATDQAVASKGWADNAKGYRDSAQVSAQAAQASAGLPPTKMPGAVLRQMLDGSGGVEWWNLVVTQIGDTIVSTQAPDVGWVPTGRIYSQSLYPQLATRLGAIADWTPAGLTIAGSTTTYNMSCVASGNGYTVALGGQNSFVSTDYMASYNVYNAYSNYSWSNIDFGFGRFVAVADNAGGVYHSLNGLGNWSIGTGTPAGGTNTRLKIGASVAFWMQGGSTASATSIDGVNWTARTLPFTPATVRPGFGRGVFVAISTTNIIWTSPDAINWNNRGAAPAVNVASSSIKIEASDTGIMLFDTAGNCAYSADGLTWAAGVKCPVISTAVAISGGAGGFVVQTVNSPTYFTTVDGSKWTARNLSVSTLQPTQGAVVYIAAIKAHLFVPSPTNASILRIKPYSYDSANQFYTTDPSATAQGLNQYIRGA